jgi:RsiW-degrading membrane proteinase PrsW (M82 family)
MTYLAIILGLLPGATWLFFYIREDPESKPKKLIAFVFLAGAASSVVALIAELFIGCGGALFHFHECIAGIEKTSSPAPLSILLFAFVEETVKFGAVYLVVRKSKAFDEPIDAMVYTAIGALGFSTIENLGAIFSGGVRLALIGAVLEIATFRFVGTTLLHTLTSAFAGYFWAHGIRNFGDKKFIAYGLMLATVLHAAFNYLILLYNNLLYPVIFVAVIGFFILGDFEKLRKEKI